MKSETTQARVSGTLDPIVGRAVGVRCKECGKLLSPLPTTWICLNEECPQAGILVPRTDDAAIRRKRLASFARECIRNSGGDPDTPNVALERRAIARTLGGLVRISF